MRIQHRILFFVLKGKRNDKRKTNDEKLRKMQNQEVTGKVYGADI